MYSKAAEPLHCGHRLNIDQSFLPSSWLILIFLSQKSKTNTPVMMWSFPHSEPKIGSLLVTATFGKLRNILQIWHGSSPTSQPSVSPYFWDRSVYLVAEHKKGAMRFLLGWVKRVSWRGGRNAQDRSFLSQRTQSRLVVARVQSNYKSFYRTFHLSPYLPCLSHPSPTSHRHVLPLKSLLLPQTHLQEFYLYFINLL